jgi:hypothetical protein
MIKTIVTTATTTKQNKINLYKKIFENQLKFILLYYFHRIRWYKFLYCTLFKSFSVLEENYQQKKAI